MNATKSSAILSGLFCFGLVAVPWFLGGNLPPVRTACLAFIFLFALLLVVTPRLIGTPTRLGLFTCLLLLLGLGYGAFQLWPGLESTHSQYPAATRTRVCELILGIGTFIVASSLFSSRRTIPWLFGLIALNGVVLTFFGIAQLVSGTDKVFWFYELIHGGQPFGPFVNGNNGGGYLLMCFAAANFFLARKIFQSQHKTAEIERGIKKPNIFQQTVNTAGRAFADLEAQQLYVLAAVVAIAVGVVMTVSRGATVALVVATMIGWVFLIRRSWTMVVVSLAVAAGGIGLVVWTEQGENIVANLETMEDLESAAENRMEHWATAWEVAQENPVFGSGLGTYKFMYPASQKTHFNRWFLHAENQYLETYSELGLVGVFILLVVIVVAFVGCVTLIGKPDAVSRSVGVTGLICLSSQVVASVFDFGLFQPGNMMLMATMMGAVFARHNWHWYAQNVTQRRSSKTQLTLGWIFLVIVAGLTAWATYEHSAVDARTLGRRFAERFDPLTDRENILTHQKYLEYALAIRPDDAEAHYQLALNHVLQYRLVAADEILEIAKNEPQVPIGTANAQADNSVDQQIEAVGDQSPDESVESIVANSNQEQAEPEFNEQPETMEEAWPRTTLFALHRLARISMRLEPEYFESLKNDPVLRENLGKAWNQFEQAEKDCDKLWLPQLRMAQLSWLMESEEQEQNHIDLAIARCPNNTNVLYGAGLLLHQSGKSDLASKQWNRCLELTREFEEPIVRFSRYELSMKMFFEQVLPTNPYFRIRLARKYFNAPEDLLLKRLLLNHTEGVLGQHDFPKAETKYLKGEIQRGSGNYPFASAYFRQALELEKDRVDWRIQYARSLIAEQQFDEAIKQLKICQLYSGEHHIVTQRLMRQATRQRVQKLKEIIRH